MYLSVDNPENSVDQDFARFTSPTVGATLGSVAILATVATAALSDTRTLPGLLGMAGAGALLALMQIAVQCQAAILVLRDRRWLPALPPAAICAATLTALYLLAFDHAAGWYLLLISAVAVAGYVAVLGEGHAAIRVFDGAERHIEDTPRHR